MKKYKDLATEIYKFWNFNLHFRPLEKELKLSLHVFI